MEVRQSVRVAIVHYWFLVYGGGERVVDALAEMYPDADIFTLFYDKDSLPPSLRGRKIKTSWLQKIPYGRSHSRELFPFYPSAIEAFDLREYDLIISSDSPPMKGVRVSSNQLHICYCHTPGRYIWDLFEEFRATLLNAQTAAGLSSRRLKRGLGPSHPLFRLYPPGRVGERVSCQRPRSIWARRAKLEGMRQAQKG